MLMAQADELQEVSGAGEGTIVVVMGLKHVRLSAGYGYGSSVAALTDVHRRYTGAVGCCSHRSGRGKCGPIACPTLYSPSCLLLHCGAILSSQSKK